MLFQTCQITLNGVSDIRDRLVAGVPLRNAPRQRRAFGDELPIFILFDDNSVEHRQMIAWQNPGVKLIIRLGLRTAE